MERYSITDIGTLAKQFASPMMDAAQLEFLAQNMLEFVRSGEGLRGVEIGTFYGDTTLYCLNVLRGAGVRADWFTIDPLICSPSRMTETRKAERRSISAICALPDFPHR